MDLLLFILFSRETWGRVYTFVMYCQGSNNVFLKKEKIRDSTNVVFSDLSVTPADYFNFSF